ncbi:DUF2243 domain-containing protein [Noviherbaspirillum aridicola]|uniref:DUF2243 domain-containing protein n=1 Tax=Noviherbaspirillum aridicola TaxID=2849687 RepID=A0ABQ4Q5G9_9BURK|nr:DUF2243 domain-containing protein [Noviherbaspirillum aridicola]GIZ52271.1 hypothetical protein NCCP691_22850 [Noviherbaspirillum aridicola]
MNVLRLQRFGGAGFLLGFAAGGFFDGILLHQILQWHHLLSGMGAPPFDDLRAQIVADGVFHALMYLIGAVGLWRLLRARAALATPEAGRELAGHALVGFGAWHMVDAILSHWLLGIHRIRMDVPNPLLWDLLWFALFGVLFIAAGLALLRRHSRVAPGLYAWAAPAAAVAVLAAALAAARAPEDAAVTVVMRPDVPATALLNQLREGERVVWRSASGDVWVLSGVGNAGWRLYGHGALLVSGTLLPAGCAAWTRT